MGNSRPGRTQRQMPDRPRRRGRSGDVATRGLVTSRWPPSDGSGAEGEERRQLHGWQCAYEPSSVAAAPIMSHSRSDSPGAASSFTTDPDREPPRLHLPDPPPVRNLQRDPNATIPASDAKDAAPMACVSQFRASAALQSTPWRRSSRQSRRAVVKRCKLVDEAVTSCIV